MKKFNVGDSVRFTGKFLKSTGQYTGSDANGEWKVIACDCELCKDGFVAVDEPSYYEPSRPRHINCANLIHTHKPDYSNI